MTAEILWLSDPYDQVRAAPELSAYAAASHSGYWGDDWDSPGNPRFILMPSTPVLWPGGPVCSAATGHPDVHPAWCLGRSGRARPKRPFSDSLGELIHW